MDLISTVILAIGLSMDAVAVSVSTSMAEKEMSAFHSFRMAFFFGIFQAVMPLLGWLAGLSFRSLIQGVDHWIAFVLLAIIGGKMIYESFHEDCDCEPRKAMTLTVLLGLAVATSIDALAAGISFALLKMSILIVVSIIGVITFTLSFIGTRIGKKVGCHFSSRVEIIGGLTLIGIGIKILIEHLVG